MRAHRLVRTARRARAALVVPAVGALLVVMVSPAYAAADAFASTTTTTTVTSTSAPTATSTTGTTSTTTTAARPTAASTPAVSHASATPTPGGVHTQVFYPVLTVSPSTGLVSGQQVTVSGRGPAAIAAECTVQGQCDDSTAVSVTPGASGAFTMRMVVRRFLHVGASTVDCAQAARCRIQTQKFGTQPALIEAWASIGFSASTPAPVAASVAPSTGLVDLQLVHVQASGFLPGALLTVQECGSGSILCTGVNAPADIAADSHGNLDTTAYLHRTLAGLNASFDCATGACVVEVQSFDGDSASATVTFDATPPPRPPLAVSATPSENLVDAASVAVHAVGFAPSDSVAVEECTVANDAHFGPFCEPLTRFGVPASGVADVAVTVSAGVPTIVPGFVQPCGTNQCELIATSRASPLESVHVPIAFGGPLPPPPPAVTMTVAPDTGLADRQAVTVSGDHLDPFSSAGLPSLTECVIGVTQFACTSGTSDALLFPDSTGHYTTTFRVARVIAGLDGTLYDCADAPGRCALTFDAGQPQVPLTFDPSLPAAAPPTAQRSPAGPLADRSDVTVNGAGFVPGSSVSASECSASTCDSADQITVTADASGAILFDLQVFRFFDDFVAGRIDCTTGCSIHLDDHTANGAAVALEFDPALGLATPTPAISVTGAHSLVGGGDTMVHGFGFGPFAVRLAECPAGAPNLDRCDAIDEAVTDGSGAFTTTTGTKAVLDTPTGALDCRTGFGVCVYAAWDGHDLFTTPIGFVAGSPTGVVPDGSTPPGGPSPQGPGPGSGTDVQGANLSAPHASGTGHTGAASETLPFTGGSPGDGLRLGLTLVVAGLFAAGIARRGRARPSRGGRSRRRR